ncbi:hypothetical protein T265_03312 [Opisthorchis viverrini]|uniref:Nonsense-mediated mRNA decay factor SMG8 n=1 Tax=Opisthorchis viverrini TaxID=6198 RepID=A0A074ZWJ4_OPIVI|nr:hypothetical protein T265_03312 [Opisthorchis viverrini]KER30262.1 hypothetical protein T265_03312 [Opisthorchis viverrini]
MPQKVSTLLVLVAFQDGVHVTLCAWLGTGRYGSHPIILPLKSRRITVISLIGEYDSFLGERPQQNVSGHPCKPTSGGLSNWLNTTQPYLDGYYDCERQIVFLTMNTLRVESILHILNEKGCDIEEFSTVTEYNTLRLLYYLLIVSHFIVITTIGTRLNPGYIKLFKMLEKLSSKMRYAVDACIRTLPLPRDWLNAGRASIPRLLFVFKLLPHVARKFAQDPGSVKQLEQNLVNQIFNTFYETGVTGNTPVNQLFILPGHNFVHVLLGTEYSSSGSGGRRMVHDGDLAQEYLESILDNMNFGHLSSKKETKRSHLIQSCLKPTDMMFEAPPEPTAWDYPPPDQPEEHTLAAFLHMHVSNMLDQLASRTGGFSQNPLVHELPTCKGWFMACYKLYTSLMADDVLPTDVVPEISADQLCEDSSVRTSLAQAWYRSLMALVSCTTVRSSGLPSSVSQDPVVGGEHTTKDIVRSQSLRTDPLYRLSEIRCRAALTAAEVHYKQDLPIHYSNTYHLVKVVSAFNVVISLARGPLVFATLEQLSKRLAHLYLAGRVTCSAVSLTGQPCQHELHRLPEEGASLRAIFLPAGKEAVCSESIITSRLATGLNREANTLLDNLVPFGLSGRWRIYWLQSLLTDQLTVKTDGAKVDADEAVVGGSSSQKPDLTPAESGDDETNQHLTVMPHRSDVILINACSCGRQQAERPDPFDYKEANWRFYSTLANMCCNKLTSIALAPQFLCDQGHPFCLPTDSVAATASLAEGQTVFRASSQIPSDGSCAAAPVAVLTRRMAALGVSTDHRPLHSGDNLSPQELLLNQPDPADADLSQPDEEELMILSTSELGDVDFRTRQQPNENDATENLSAMEGSESDSTSESSLTSRAPPSEDEEEVDVDQPLAGCRRLPAKDGSCSESRSPSPSMPAEHSAPLRLVVRFRDGVPSSNWIVGEIPRYPSWSIYALGKYFSYSHSSGLSCRGFLRNSNFLLPWDVTIGAGAWAFSDRGGRGGKSGRGGKFRGGRADSDTVKLFIGFEMECPLGHRFFLAGPDRAMDGPMQSSQVRRAVHGLLTRDLPLYMPCRCRTVQTNDPLGRGAGCLMSRPDNTAEWDSSGATSTDNNGRPVVWAQLTRIYLAIPAAPIRVRFQPRIRPGAPRLTPTFHLGHTVDQCAEGCFEASSDSEREITADEDSDPDHC